MKSLVISYSLTGNNDALAASVATALAAEHARITEPKPRTNGTIAMDMLLNRSPKIVVPAADAEACDLVVFCGPVWMGQIASPLRTMFKQLGPSIGQYAFISISGGADGPNPKLASELTKRLHKEPACLLDMHIADLLPSEPKPTRDDTSNYRLTPDDVQHLTGKVVETLRVALVG